MRIHCPYCALQCAMRIETMPSGTLAARGDADFDVNAGALCVKGFTAADTLAHPDRLLQPLVRRGGEFVTASWDEALDAVVAGFRAVAARHGADAVAVFGSGALTSEKAYALGKFARLAVGTRNFDYNGRFCMSSAAVAANRAFGIDRGLPFPLAWLDDTACLLLAGGNPADTMPPLARRLENRRGTSIVIDPRRTAYATAATLHLQPAPGTDLALAHALLHVVVVEGRVDRAFVESRTNGFAAVRRRAEHEDPERAERRTGVAADDIRRAARFLEELDARDASRFAITVFGDEPGGAYNRIALSGVLGGTRAADDIVTHVPSWYAERNIVLRPGLAIARIDREACEVVDAAGGRTPYDALVFATGSAPFVPPIPGIDGADVYAFRTLDDCARIADAAAAATRAVVLGGGLLGLEAASGLRARGVAVTVVHAMPTLMERQLDDDGGRALAAKMEALGIAVRAHAATTHVVRDDASRLTGVDLADGTHVAADVLVVCCGIVPRVDLARAAGLACERGIVVDDTLRTSDERVYAIGECASHRGIAYGLVEPLWEQCRTLAERLTGTRSRYAGSTIGTRLKVAGVNVVSYGRLTHSAGDETVVSFGADGSYRKAIARDGKLVGAQVVGDATAAAALSRAFAADAPLPGSLAGLIFGSGASGPPATASSAAGEPADRVCHCNAVDAPAIVAAIAGGAHDVDAIGQVTLAGTGCGGCKSDLTLFLEASRVAS